MLAEIDPHHAAELFLRSSQWSDFLETDLNVAPSLQSPRVRLAIQAPWVDAGRAARAIALIDKELRRAAAAWTSAASEQGLLDLGEVDQIGRATSLDDVVRGFRDELVRLVPPGRTNAGHLQLVATRTEPFAVLLEPQDRLAALLSACPAAALSFAMSAFGQSMALAHHWHADLDGARYAGPDETLAVLLGTLDGQWAGSNGGVRRAERELRGRPASYRAVAPVETTGTGPHFPAAAVLYAAGGPHGSVLVSIKLHGRTTNIKEYDDSGLTTVW